MKNGLKSMQKIAVVVPNWNGMDSLKACLDSLLAQTRKHQLIVVENGSTDGSLEFLRNNYPEVTLVTNSTNLGFAGGVNSGIRVAIKDGCDAVALFNNDAVAEPGWLEHLASVLKAHDTVGIVTCKFLTEDGKKIDSTGDYYTNWGLPYPRGRGESDIDKYDSQTEVFGASGGASLYRTKMLSKIGLFDEDFFAYYEDVDISFRAQLAGWKVRFEPKSVAYHQISATTSKIKGFATYQTMKNLPLILVKNVPRRYLWRVGWRLFLAQTLFLGRAITRGDGKSALSGDFRNNWLLFKKVGDRRKIQKSKKLSNTQVWNIITHDLPPNAHSLRRLRKNWRKLTFRGRV